MRGLAAIRIMVSHAGLYSESHAYLFYNCRIAVDFFFMLSGFVLTHTYGSRRHLGLGQFMIRRLVRLYPMFLAGLVLGGTVLVLATKHGLDTMTPKAAIAATILNASLAPFFTQ